jgi:prepilin-type N-terminal cleavage/methylation domain-containing protein
MFTGKRGARARGGFTILELLVVVSIMAVIATLATGAAIKSVKSSRNRRVDAMARALEMALANYRAQENQWPFSRSDLQEDPRDKAILWAHGVDNVKVFQKMYHGSGGQSTTVYLDTSAFLTQIQGSGLRVPLRTALDLKKHTEAPIGYPLPENPNIFYCYCVCYNTLTDTVKVYTQHNRHPKLSDYGEELQCPNPKWNK